MMLRQAIGDLSGDVYAKILPNYNLKDKEATLKYADLMVELCKDMDKLLATTKDFMVSSRLEDAKNRGVTDEDKLYYEKLERTFLTYWVLDDPQAGKGGGLTDYCNRHLSGLMTDYYGMRWQKFSEHVAKALDAGLTKDQFKSTQQPELEKDINAAASAWTASRESYPTVEQGDPLQISTELLEKYRSLIVELVGFNDSSKDLPLKGQTATAGSAQNNATEGPASLAIDNNPSTMWHTSWNGSARKDQWIDIALDSSKLVDGFRYLPRQGGGINGLITEYAIDLSNDGGATYHEVAAGKWEDNTLWKQVSFPEENATNVRLRTIDAKGGDKLFASAAEVRITTPDNASEQIMEQLNSWISKSEQVKAGEYSEGSVEALQAVAAEAKKAVQSGKLLMTQAKELISKLESAYGELSGLESLTIKLPTKVLYKINEQFAEAGMTVTATYKDQSTRDVTKEVELSGFDSSKSGEKTITVSYFNVTETFIVTVEDDKPPVEDDTPPVTTDKPSIKDDKLPVTGSSNTTATVDSKGNANVTITENNILEVIQAAKKAASKEGSTARNITAIIHIASDDKSINRLNVNLPKDIQNYTIDQKLANVVFVMDKLDVSLSIDGTAIKEMNKQAKDDIQIITNVVDIKELSKEANAVIGKRPVFDFKAAYANGSKSITNFGNGKVTLSLPYALAPGEKASNVCGIYVDNNGKVNYIKDSVYNQKEQQLQINTNHFSVYGVGYKGQQEDTAKKETVKISYQKLQLQAKGGNKQNVLTWKPVKNADGYIVYGAASGSKKMKVLKVIKKKGTTSFQHTKLKAGTYYKYQVKAYQLKENEKEIQSVSKLIHSATAGSKKGNPVKVTISPNILTLEKKQKKKISGKVTGESKKEIKEYTAALRYENSNSSIATVSSTGVITAKAEGFCYIYVCAQNGISKKVLLTVE